MSKLQQSLTRNLRANKRRIGVPLETLKRWERGASSPTLETFEKVCEKNGIEVPFFFSGDISELSAYVKRCGQKNGLDITLTYDSL